MVLEEFKRLHDNREELEKIKIMNLEDQREILYMMIKEIRMYDRWLRIFYRFPAGVKEIKKKF